MMFVDPASGDINKILYKTDIDSLCDGMSLSFSAWFMDLNNHTFIAPVSPKIEMQMLNKLDNSIIITSGIVTILPNGDTWLQYGFDFDLPAGLTNVTFRIINKDNSTIGNDLGIDDIEVRFCTPPVVVNLSDTVEKCEGLPFTLNGTYTDDGTFGNNLDYRWEYSTTGNINVQSDWSIVLGSGGSTTTGIVTSSHTIPSLVTGDAGYYRLVVGTNLNKWACRAKSKVVQLTVDTFSTVEPIIAVTDEVVCKDATIQLSCATPNGVWTLSNNNAQIDGSNTDNPITIKGLTAGQVFATYTVGAGVCQTTVTFLIKVIPQAPPEIRIGFEK